MSITESWIIHNNIIIPNLAKNATITSVKNGNWSDPTVWSLNRIPNTNDTVHIFHNITLADSIIKDIYIGSEGVLDCNNATHLHMRNMFIEGKVLANLVNNEPLSFVFRDIPTSFEEDPASDPDQLGPILTILPMGVWDVKGTVKDVRIRSVGGSSVGDTSVTLDRVPNGWRVGDDIWFHNSRSASSQWLGGQWQGWNDLSEWRKITGINGSIVSFDQPLNYARLSYSNNKGEVIANPHVCNATRNIKIYSESNQRNRKGHCVATGMATLNSVATEITNTGRTSGMEFISATNPKGRYAGWHLHGLHGPMMGLDGNKYSFIINNCSIHHSNAKAGFTVHHSSFGHIHDNFISNIQGNGIWDEEANSSGNDVHDNVIGFIDGASPGNYDQNWDIAGSQYIFRNGLNHVYNNYALGGTRHEHAQGFNFYMQQAFQDDLNEITVQLERHGPDVNMLANNSGNVEYGYKIENNEVFGPCWQAFAGWNMNGGKGRLVKKPDGSTSPWLFKNNRIFGCRMGWLLYNGTDYHLDGFTFINHVKGGFSIKGIGHTGGDSSIEKISIKNVYISGCDLGLDANPYSWPGHEFLVDTIEVHNARVGIHISPGQGAVQYGDHWNTRNIFKNVIIGPTCDQSFSPVYGEGASWSSWLQDPAPALYGTYNYSMSTIHSRYIEITNYNGNNKKYQMFMFGSEPNDEVNLFNYHPGRPFWTKLVNGERMPAGFFYHGLKRSVAEEIAGAPNVRPTNLQVKQWLDNNPNYDHTYREGGEKISVNNGYITPSSAVLFEKSPYKAVELGTGPEIPAPIIHSFVATPSTITLGESSTLSWDVSDATSLTINNTAVSGTSITVTPDATTNYVLRAINSTATVEANLSVTVEIPQPQPPVINSFNADPLNIKVGEYSVLSWDVSNADSVYINNNLVSGTNLSVNPNQTTVYTLKAVNVDGSAIDSITITVTALQPPIIDSFNADPISIDKGETSVLSWSVRYADYITINGSTMSGNSLSVTPDVTTDYTILAGNNDGWVSQKLTVVVSTLQAPVINSFNAIPSTIDLGESSTLTWDVVNATSITIDGNIITGNSLSVSPSETKTYNLVATNDAGSVSSNTTVTISDVHQNLQNQIDVLNVKVNELDVRVTDLEAKMELLKKFLK